MKTQFVDDTFSRSRRNDPAVNVDGAEFMKKTREIDQPRLDEELVI